MSGGDGINREMVKLLLRFIEIVKVEVVLRSARSLFRFDKVFLRDEWDCYSFQCDDLSFRPRFIEIYAGN